MVKAIIGAILSLDLHISILPDLQILDGILSMSNASARSVEPQAMCAIDSKCLATVNKRICDLLLHALLLLLLLVMLVMWRVIMQGWLRLARPLVPCPQDRCLLHHTCLAWCSG